MEILFAPQGLAKSLKVFERPSWLAVDKKEGQEWLRNQERKKKNIVAFQCSQTQQSPPKPFFLQWRKQQKCDVCFSCFSSPPALSISVYHSCSNTVNNTIKQTTKKQRAFMRSSYHLRSLVHLWVTFFSDLQNLTRIVWIQVWWPSSVQLTHADTSVYTRTHYGADSSSRNRGDRCLGLWEPDTHRC